MTLRITPDFGAFGQAFTERDEDPEEEVRTVVTDFAGRVKWSAKQIRPEVLEDLAVKVGVVLRPDRACRAYSLNLDTGLWVACCRSAHADAWHIDGRWPTTPWREDQIGELLAGVSR